MQTEPETFDLAELCEAADVTPRTVRYYVQQGLLPSPGTRGPKARYDRGHLDRVLLIKRLQRDHLPLAEIRRQLESLNDGAIASLLREQDDQPASSSALDYLRGVLEGRKPSKRAPTVGPPSPPSPLPKLMEPTLPYSVAGGVAPMSEADDSFYDIGTGTFSPQHDATDTTHEHQSISQRGSRDRSTWERITLAPDIELHVRRPMSRPENKLVDRLIEYARSLFSHPEDRS